MNTSLGDRIKTLRKENNITQKKLASILNISNSTLSQYESNKRVPNDEIKKEIAKFFNVSMDYLMGLSNIKNPYDQAYPDNINLSLEILEMLSMEGEITDQYLNETIPKNEKENILKKLKKMIAISKFLDEDNN